MKTETQLEADYARDKVLVERAATAKEIYELAWRRGRSAGFDDGSQFAVRGETVNSDLADKVLNLRREAEAA